MGRLLLLLNSEGLHVQLMDNGRIAMQYGFPASQEGREAFAALLQTVTCPATLLVDIIEEDFRQETVPHLTGGKRNALVRRKFEQFYRDTSFRQASLLKRQKGGRRDDEMLFSALTDPARLTPWLDIMQAHRIPLTGIYSVPQASAPLVEGHCPDHLLLVSWEKHAGLRQTYFGNRRLQISRLTPVDTGVTFREAVAAEIGHTCQYLRSLSLLPPDQTLCVRLLVHSSGLNELRQALPTREDIHYEFSELADIAGRLGIGCTIADSDASQIFLHQLLAKPPKTGYADETHTRHHALWRLRKTLNRGSAALLLGSLLCTAAIAWQGSRGTEETATLNTEAQRIENEARQIALAFPAASVPPPEMKAAVSGMRQLGRYGSEPGDVLRPLGAILNRYPKIELNAFAWNTDAAEPGAPDNAPILAISLSGRMTGFGNDYRAALDYLNDFRRDLNAQGYQADVLRRPLDISPEGSIGGEREPGGETQEFSLKLSRRLPP